MLGYGTFLEYKREIELCENISFLQHKVAFAKFWGSKPVALLKFAEPDNLGSENLSIRVFIARVSFRPPLKQRKLS